MAIRTVSMSVSDLDEREARLRDLARGFFPGIGHEVRLTPAGMVKAQQELAQIRRMRQTALIAGAR